MLIEALSRASRSLNLSVTLWLDGCSDDAVSVAYCPDVRQYGTEVKERLRKHWRKSVTNMRLDKRTDVENLV
jgi:hypothetical protein